MKSGCQCSSLAAREQLLAVRQRRDEPLARGDDLEGAFALLVELDRVGDRTQLADQLAALAQRLDDGRAHLVDGAALELGVERAARLRGRATGQPSLAEVGTAGIVRRGRSALGSAATARATRSTSVVSPKVQIIAIPDPFSGSASSWASTGTSTPNSGVTTVGAEERLVARVVGVRDERDATREQLGSRGLDLDRAGVVRLGEGDAVVVARALAVLEFGLGDGCAKVDVPERGRHGRVDLAARSISKNAALGDRLGVGRDRRVLEGPVDAEAQVSPEVLEDLLVGGGEAVAQLDEVLARD